MSLPTSLRDRRNIFGPTHFSISNYCTQTKSEMKATFADDYFLNNLHLIPDTFKEKLSNTISEEKMPPSTEFGSDFHVKIENTDHRTDYSPLAGIANFFSGVMNVISTAMFSKRKQSEFGSESGGKMALEGVWHGAKLDDENKTLQDENRPNGGQSGLAVLSAAEMGECRAAADSCQNKLDKVRLLLSKPVPCSGRARRRPKKEFVDPSSVEDCFEDAFAPEDFENLPNSVFLEYVSPQCYHTENLHEIAAPKVKSEISPIETTHIVKKLDLGPIKTTDIAKNMELNPIETTDIVKNVTKPELVAPTVNEGHVIDKKNELVSSCEDKLSKLKALLQNRRKKANTESVPEITVTEPQNQTKVVNKHYKNPHRCNDKRRKSRMKQNIQNDLLFANEINNDELSSVENSPSTNNGFFFTKPQGVDYFDEISGRFHSTSVSDSEDFQIVFNDSPRLRRPSDCESEDSIEIVFEDSPDSCYTSNDCYTNNDVFGNCSDIDSDSDSDLSDSGCGNMMIKLSHSLSKSVSNLTDDSLYVNENEDEVDSAKVDLTVCDTVTADAVNTGLLIDSNKKEIKKNLPVKRVHFSTQPDQVRVMRVWDFASRQARPGPWERYARDRERFKRRIENLDVALSWVLKPQHRSRVMFQRFMPWWNAQKRRELAEKKQKEENDKREAEERELERVKQEKAREAELQEQSNVENEGATHDIGKDIQEGVLNRINSGKDLETEQSNTENERQGLHVEKEQEVSTVEESLGQETTKDIAVLQTSKNFEKVRENVGKREYVVMSNAEDEGARQETKIENALKTVSYKLDMVNTDNLDKLKDLNGVTEDLDNVKLKNVECKPNSIQPQMVTEKVHGKQSFNNHNICSNDEASRINGTNELYIQIPDNGVNMVICADDGINSIKDLNIKHHAKDIKDISGKNKDYKNISDKQIIDDNVINNADVKNGKLDKTNRIIPINDKLLEINGDFGVARTVANT